MVFSIERLAASDKSLFSGSNVIIVVCHKQEYSVRLTEKMAKDKIITVPNPDKEGHHQDARKPGLYPPHPARIIFSGRSGCGKGVAAKNLLARASPPFERIVIWHYDTESLEWDDCEPSDAIAELPDDPSEFWAESSGIKRGRDQKNLIVCDEIPWEQLNKAGRMKADRLMQYATPTQTRDVQKVRQQMYKAK